MRCVAFKTNIFYLRFGVRVIAEIGSRCISAGLRLAEG